MLKSNASRVVLVIVLGIAVFELGITGKFGQIWALAFTATKQPAPSAKQPSSPGPTVPPVVIA